MRLWNRKGGVEMESFTKVTIKVVIIVTKSVKCLLGH